VISWNPLGVVHICFTLRLPKGFTALHCTALHCTALHCSDYLTADCTLLPRLLINISKLQFLACHRLSSIDNSLSAPYPVLLCSAVQCSAVQCSAVQCSAVQCPAAEGDQKPLPGGPVQTWEIGSYKYMFFIGNGQMRQCNNPNKQRNTPKESSADLKWT
jgi:hypothetical protein